MNRELLQNVLVGIDALITEELKVADPLRYHRISKLCDKAHDLLQMGAARVGQVADRPMGITRYVGPEPIALEGMAVGIGGHSGETSDLVRELIGAIATLTPARDGKAHEAAARALERLLDLRDRLSARGRDTTTLDAKIDRALTELERAPLDLTEAHHGSPNLADSHLLRGHSPRGNGQGLLQADDDEADGAGARDSDGADPAGAEEGLDRG